MTTVIIPARLNSKRLPRKLLKIWRGDPIICWTVRQALRANVGNVVVITDSDEILEELKHYQKFYALDPSAEIILRDEEHPSGTSRALSVAPADGPIIVFQGDSPLIRPEDIQALSAALYMGVQYATLGYRTPSDVIINADGVCTRNYMRHIGIYGFHDRVCLKDMVESDVEPTEGLEQTVIPKWTNIEVEPYDYFSIDTPEDFERLRKL